MVADPTNDVSLALSKELTGTIHVSDLDISIRAHHLVGDLKPACLVFVSCQVRCCSQVSSFTSISPLIQPTPSYQGDKNLPVLAGTARLPPSVEAFLGPVDVLYGGGISKWPRARGQVAITARPESVPTCRTAFKLPRRTSVDNI